MISIGSDISYPIPDGRPYFKRVRGVTCPSPFIPLHCAAPMKVLLVGNGGREHALAWKLAQSPRVTALYAAPGNPGIANVAEVLPRIGVMDFAAIDRFVRDNRVEFVVIGPEDPLAAGLADRMRDAGVKVFGPTRDGARVEADKW